jgi:hypothetical protein
MKEMLCFAPFHFSFRTELDCHWRGHTTERIENVMRFLNRLTYNTYSILAFDSFTGVISFWYFIIFTTQELVDNVLSGWFRSSLGVLEYQMHLMVKLASSQPRPRNEHDNVMNEFTTQALTNLHASSHVNTYFKKGFECQSKLPQRPC